ncbi:leucine-rich repeat neuronal protein 2-like [Morone saxatilis]|uniref:leucine-rich repeat neuronal protein 2-like n=1 Tax=Morone saxatilis TaxID=34816 RepID=UPI0015E23D24|nr:leucine-rich repeat neuronal protein 2-like [Morone saxatilis]XP_035518351.1 leucine-rich repeat neuronal protein 2-like [Morone saxatilis]XP_035518352.1 leucine-rich repeat neuronal protein 2-like [Morone saxatilis]
MRPTLVFLQTQCLLCVFVGVCVPDVVGSLPHALPWHVSCPSRCACQIKPWFSPDSVYHEAPTVDCNDLLLTKLPLPIPTNTHTLRLQSNLLSEIDTAVLHRLPNLTDLDLSQNRFTRVRTITQSSSLPSLLSLHLEENHLSRLPDASFSSLPTLQELFLSHNNLHSIAPGAFTGLDSLLRLHINNNRLTTVDPRWFRSLPHLEVLMLGGNPVEVLPERGFLALKSLRSLVLGGMGLRSLAEKALEGLEGLESLSFYDNRLTKVPTQALRRVPGLKFLDLNKNRIKLIETGDFRDMIHLKELGLNNMEELVSIERVALENLPELTKLEITNNPRLSYIHPQAFLQLSRLESLMLNSNSLSAVHQHIMLSLPSLQEVSLHSNPLRCDCLFHWAAKEASHPHSEDTQTDVRTARMVRFIQPQATLCSEPPELRARRVRDVSSREMSASCLPMIPTSSLPSYVGVREGGKLVLHCRALADPQPELYWVTPSGLRLGPAPSHTSKRLPAPAPCHSLTDSEGFNHTSASSASPSQDDTLCNPSKPYQLLPEGTLEMNKVTPSEAGLYTCVAENALGADTRSVTVGVHGREKKRKRGVAANIKRYPLYRADVRLEVKEVGQHYAILSWQTGHNFPSTRLSWQAIYSNAHTPTYTTRILAGTQSFNLTHLQAETFYRVCLHLGVDEGAKHSGRRSRESKKTQCVSFRTKDVPEPQPSLQLSPELTSTAVTLLLLALILLLLAGQGWDSEGAGKYHSTVLQEIKSPKALAVNQKTEGSNKHTPEQSEKLLLHQDC